MPNPIAAILLETRDRTDKQAHTYFGWAKGNPPKYLAKVGPFDDGDIAPLTHEVLRKAEPEPRKCLAIHVGCQPVARDRLSVSARCLASGGAHRDADGEVLSPASQTAPTVGETDLNPSGRICSVALHEEAGGEMSRRVESYA